MKPRIIATTTGLGVGLGLAAAAALATSAPADATAHVRWHAPDCVQVQSEGLLTFTHDEGATVTPTTGSMHETRYIFDIAPLATPNEMLAVDNTGALSLSADAGCSWTQVNQVAGIDQGRLAASPDGSAYLWNLEDTRLLHVTGARVSKLPPLADDDHLEDLAVDRRDSRHLRAVTRDGRVLDSTDAGAHFRQVGRPAGGSTMWLYSAAIDPKNLDHLVLGDDGSGSYATFNGGRTWIHDGMGRPGEDVNAFSVAISSASSRVVYAQGINLAEHAAGVPSEGRHVYRSVDGGRTFRPVLDQGRAGVPYLQNGTLLAPSPADPFTVHFVYSTSYLGHGTDLYTLDTRHDRLSMANDRHTRLTTITFNPADPSVMYLGFGAEFIS